jgi:hypothetical protein
VCGKFLEKKREKKKRREKDTRKSAPCQGVRGKFLRQKKKEKQAYKTAQQAAEQ